MPWRGRSAEHTEAGGALERQVAVGEIVDELADDELGTAERGRLLARLAAALAGGARAAGARAALSGRYLADVVTDLAPQVVVRDLPTLRAAHSGLAGDALAQALVTQASRVTAGIGAAGGAISAVGYAAPPTLLIAPVKIATETVAVVLVELKLVAELHVVFGRAAAGTPAQQTAAYLQAWVAQKGLGAAGETPGIAGVLATAARSQLRNRLVRRFGREVTTLAPLMLGAAAGAELNRRETRSIGERLRADLAPGRR